MNKYIVSLVLAKKVPQQKGSILLSGDKPDGADISIQNEVFVLVEDDPKSAFDKCARLAKEKHPGHAIVVQVVVEMNEAMVADIN